MKKTKQQYRQYSSQTERCERPADGHGARAEAHGGPATHTEELVRWTAGLGAVTAQSVSVHAGVSVASARARLAAAERRGLLLSHRPLRDTPALYAATRVGLRAVGAHDLGPCRVSAATAAHQAECARVAAELERRYPGHRVQGERELRAIERELGRAVASAEVTLAASGAAGLVARSRRRAGQRPLHRPDLVLWADGRGGGLPVAVEVELTAKAPARLAAICLAWARARTVSGVLYLAPPEVERAVRRAIAQAHAGERVVVVPLAALGE